MTARRCGRAAANRQTTDAPLRSGSTLQSHTQIHTQEHTNIHTYTHTHTPTQDNTNTPSHKHTHHLRMQTLTCTYAHTQIPTQAHMHSHTSTQVRTHQHSLTQACTCTLSHAHVHTDTPTHTHFHAGTYRHSNTYAHTLTHFLSLPRTLPGLRQTAHEYRISAGRWVKLDGVGDTHVVPFPSEGIFTLSISASFLFPLQMQIAVTPPSFGGPRVPRDTRTDRISEDRCRRSSAGEVEPWGIEIHPPPPTLRERGIVGSAYITLLSRHRSVE